MNCEGIDGDGTRDQLEKLEGHVDVLRVQLCAGGQTNRVFFLENDCRVFYHHPWRNQFDREFTEITAYSKVDGHVGTCDFLKKLGKVFALDENQQRSDSDRDSTEKNPEHLGSCFHFSLSGTSR